MAELMGLVPGMALDLTSNDCDGKPWDFNVAEKRERESHGDGEVEESVTDNRQSDVFCL